MPDSLKNAFVTPLIKKTGLDPDDLKSYRPISNLSFTSKLLEKVAAQQLTQHLQDNGLSDKFQSAYRAGHSTESALLRIKNDFDSTLDARYRVALVMLDLSAAFDTIDHAILLNRLASCCGVTGVALEWVRSYLTGRPQSVIIGDATSDPVDLTVGVPQGSVLGLLLFSIYGLEYHCYSDDTQVYTRFCPRDPESLPSAIRRLEACLNASLHPSGYQISLLPATHHQQDQVESGHRYMRCCCSGTRHFKTGLL